MEITRQDFHNLYLVIAGLTLAQLHLMEKICPDDDLALDGLDLTSTQRRILEFWFSAPERKFIACKHVGEEIKGREPFFPK